jgi:uncharacterized phage-associated protein
MRSAVDSIFDVAFWLADTALNSNEYLQPQKLQRMLFLCQSYYAVVHNGRKLMPATFVADEMGPIEPNIYQAFSKGRPNMEVSLFLDPDIEGFLESIWSRFGNYSTERLTEMTMETLAFKQAIRHGQRSEISLESMMHSFIRANETPSIDQVVKPKIMRSQTGKPVAVQAWNPAVISKKK